MKMNKEDLIALLQGEIKGQIEGGTFAEMITNTIKGMVQDLQNDVANPFAGVSAKQLISNLPFAKVDGDFMSTKQGSIINLKNKQTPWVHVSEEVSAWAKDFASYLKTGQVSKLLSESVDTEGGYLVPEEFRAIMIMYDVEPTLVWQRATVWPMGGPKLAFPKLNQDPDEQSENFDHFAGVSFAWTEEGGEKEQSEPNFGLVELIAHELAGYTEVTNTLLDDSVINLVNFLTRIFRAAWYWKTDKSFISGTGGKQPLGVLNDPGILTVARQTAGTVEVDDILNMEARMPTVFDNGSVWFITKQARTALRGQKTTEGELILKESFANISDGYNMSLLGRPAVMADGKIPTIGNTGDVVLGNWSNYYVGFPQDFSMDSSKHFQFRKNRTALRCSGRVDGLAAQAKAFVALGPKS